MNLFNFGCNQCGKCCNKNPELLFEEVFNYADSMFIQTHHKGIISKSQSPLESEQLKHLNKLCHTIINPDTANALYYFIQFSGVQFQHEKSCVMLKDKLCSDYENRPLSCQLFPFDPYFPENHQINTLNKFKDYAEKKNYECQFESKYPVIYINNELNNAKNFELSTSSFYEYLFSNKDFLDHFIKFISNGGEAYKNQHLQSVWMAVNNGGSIYADMIISLQVGIFAELINDEQANLFMEKQIKFINNAINEAMIRKNKDDRALTTLMRTQKENYEKALSQNIMETTYQQVFGDVKL